MKLKRPVMALGLLAIIATPVLAAGLWPNLPIVGSASFCASSNTAGVPGTASVCTTTAPAGPSIVTGLETIPADTNKASGAAPQTVKLTLGSLNALPVSFTAGSSSVANTVTATATQGGVVLTNASSLTNTTVTLPPSPIDGQQFLFTANQNIASLTVNAAAGATVSNAPTALTVSTTGSFGYRFRYNAGDSKWYRID